MRNSASAASNSGVPAASPFSFSERFGDVIGLAGRVLAAFGHREITVNGRQHVRAERQVEPFLEGVGRLQIRRQEHETEVGLGRDDAEGEELRVLGGANFLDEQRQVGLGGALFVRAEKLPLAVFDPVKQVQERASLPAARWDQRNARSSSA